MTLSEALDSFFLTYQPSTRGAYGTALKRLFAVGEVTTLAQVKTMKPEGFVRIARHMGETHKPATVAQSVAALRQFYRFLSAEDPSVGDPTRGYRCKRPNNVPEWNVLREGDLAQLLEQITEPRDKAVILTLALQGWRVSELRKMTWKNISKKKDGWVVEWKGKGLKFRVQGLQAAVLEAVTALGDKRTPGAPFIPNEEGKPFSSGEVYRLVKRHTVAFGRRVTPHGLRATYISSVISRKGIEVARQLAGHADLSSTQRYSRWQVDRDDPLTAEDL